MILPTKHLPTKHSLIGCGAHVVKHMRRPRKISALWEDVRADGDLTSFNKFLLTLDALYILGIITKVEDRIALRRSGSK